jgi:katanin p80 WD40 repeat-containing subunit B1
VVVAGSSSGTLKLWDLSQARCVRTLTGHRANASSVDFHPHGEFFVTGSRDTNVKVWDIRRKGCIQTYKGHAEGVNVVRFSPDGRWVVSGGADGVVKLWDLGAGKFMRDFTLHRGAITSIEFHPQEFLLATASADRTVRFWDLETFELVATSPLEATAVRCARFSADGECLLSGTQDTLRLCGWEPPAVHDTVDVGWGRLADLAVANDQLVGASIYQASVSIHVVNLAKCQPFVGLGHRAAGETFSTPAGGDGAGPHGAAAAGPLAVQGSNAALRADGAPSGGARSAGSLSGQPPPSVSSSSRKLPWDRPSNAAPSRHNRIDDDDGHDDDDDSNIDGGGRGGGGGGGGSGGSGGSGSGISSTRDGRREAPSAFVPRPAATGAVPTAAAAGAAAVVPPIATGTLGSSNGASAAASRRIVPSDRDAPLGLNVASFMPDTAAAAVAGDVREEHVLEDLTREHSAICGLLASRLNNLKLVRTFWDSGDVAGAVDCVLKINDRACTVDLLRVFRRHPQTLSLDIAISLLPEILSLAGSQYEDHVVTAVEILSALCTSFGPLVQTTLRAPAPVGIDMAREERLEKCKIFRDHLDRARKLVEPLTKQRRSIAVPARVFVKAYEKVLQ